MNGGRPSCGRVHTGFLFSAPGSCPARQRPLYSAAGEVFWPSQDIGAGKPPAWRRPCGHQVSAHAIEARLREEYCGVTGWYWKGIRSAITSKVSSMITGTRVRAKVVPPPAPGSDGNSAEVQLPIARRTKSGLVVT